METDKTEVFKNKLLSRLYGTKGCSDSEDSDIHSEVETIKCPAESSNSSRTRKIYSAALPEKWPPSNVSESVDNSEENLQKSSSSTEDSPDEEIGSRKRKRRRKQKKQSEDNSVLVNLKEKSCDLKIKANPELTRNQKRKLKKKRRKDKNKQTEQCSSKSEFVYLGSNST